MNMLVVNPLKRKRSKSKRKVRRNPIANLGGFAKRKSSSTRRRKPRTLKQGIAQIARRPSRRRRASAFVSNIRRRATSSATAKGFVSAMMPAAIGAGGALAVDLLWGYVPIPDSLKTGPLAPLTRLAGAFAIGMAAGLVGGKKFGAEATAGALTVTTYDLVKGYLKNNTQLPLSYYAPAVQLGYALPRRRGLGYFVPQGGGESDRDDEFDPQGSAIDSSGEYLAYMN